MASKMSKPKTNNHENIRRRLPAVAGSAMARQAKVRNHETGNISGRRLAWLHGYYSVDYSLQTQELNLVYRVV